VEIADLFASLMTDVLGYRASPPRAATGARSSPRAWARRIPTGLAGIHVNLLAVRRDQALPPTPTEEEKAYLEEISHWMREETGYMQIQGTKPQTLAYGLSDSPAGLAAWIVEKFRTWSDCGGDVERRFSRTRCSPT
jgi:microsomal epoxide hydrolase